ncbi:MAG: AAA family ATPase [Planctomycetes bacterium]|nr:AAA family ATPase [Planctomycetota bacterium]
MTKKIILGLVGPIASGKGTIAAYLEKKYSASAYRFSTIMRDLLIRLHLPLTRENMQDISTILRQRFGEDLFAKVIAENVLQDNNKIIVVDGIRRLADIKYLARVNDFLLVKITADSHLRYQRLIKRTENSGDAQKTYEAFLSDHNREADAEIPLVAQTAPAEIKNNSTFAELYAHVEKFIS